ncbi:quinone oxidoreductase family protein [Nocardia veterana]|uniref:Zinc-binding alcohol dehydrogenase family protein n=1 Tax=Nocardia veterana TaxID=132249 RepID=A0A7X6RKW5_9NOCA|nr:zinc-binding alcohol dehydrogenase family protein [Nocardia veterana]NKY89615.1 zinc-binding alcohol dehydrogenase family protein [Nocardia veterana]
MRALVMTAPGGAEKSEVREVDPPRPAAGEVTVDVAYAGVNFMDVMARRGDAGYASSWPYRPGLEIAGTVREAGAGVTGLAVGDRVAAVALGGGFAEIATARAELTVRVPDAVPLSAAAATPLGLATALLLLTEAGRFTPGDTVLVHSAAGGVGGAVAQLVPLLGGGRLLGTVSRSGRPVSGYDAVLVRGDGLADEIRAATDGRGVDLVLDPLGTEALDLDLAVTRPTGRIVLFGNAGGGTPAPLPPFGRLLGGNLTLTGFSHRGLVAGAPAKVAAATRRVLDYLAEGALSIPVTELGSLDEVIATHDLLASGQGVGKYVARIR